MRKLVIFLTLIANSNIITPCTLQQSWTAHQILDQFRYYKLVHSHFHAGDLLQHSVWVCRSLAQWFDEDKFWVEQLKPIKNIVMLGGLLHDIGKAGDLTFFYTHKKTHPIAGTSYILNKKIFWRTDGSPLYLDNLFRELEVSPEEQKMLAIFIAMHMEFGTGILKRLQKEGLSVLDEACNNYLSQLRKQCQEVDFNNGVPTLQLLHAALAVSAADVRGIQPNSYIDSTLVTLLGHRVAYGYGMRCYRGFDAYERFDFEGQGRMVRDHLSAMLLRQLG